MNVTGCGKVSGVFEMDGTVGVKEEQRKQMITMAKRVASDLPAGSDASFSFITDRHIKVPTLDGVSLDVFDTGSYKITASAIEAGIMGAFPIGPYKIKAEIMYLLVSDSTKLDIPSIVLKKKMFVIVFGSSISSSLKRIATSDSHIHLVQNDEDISNVAELIRNQTCQDSQYVCDVDKYKENKRYSSCKDCFNICAQRQIVDTGCPRCPYMRLQPKAQEVKSVPGNDDDIPVRYIKDNKSSVVIAIVLSLVTICLVSVILTSVYMCYRRRVACFGQDPANRIIGGMAAVEVGQEDPHAAANDNNIPLIAVHRPQSQLENGEDGNEVGRQGFINLRHSHSACGVEETCL